MKKTLEELYTREQFRTAAEVARTFNFGYCPIVFSAKEKIRFEHYKANFVDIRAYYLVKVWQKAMNLTENKHYSWLEHFWAYDADGYFKKLVFTYNNLEQAKKDFWRFLAEVADSGAIKVHQEIVKEGEDLYCIGFEKKKKFSLEETEKLYFWKWNEIKDYFFELTTEEIVLVNGKELNQCSTRDLPLFEAAEKLRINDVEKAIANGANVNAINYEGNTVLQIVFKDGCFEKSCDYEKIKKITNILIQHGANINLYGFNSLGLTPDVLTSAIFFGSDMVAFVLSLGANPNQNYKLCEYGNSNWEIQSAVYDFLKNDIGVSRILWEIEEGEDLFYDIQQNKKHAAKLKAKYDAEIKYFDEYEADQQKCLNLLKEAGANTGYIAGWDKEKYEAYNQEYDLKFSKLSK